MGIVSSLLSQSKNKMKFLLVIALAAYAQAEAEAEADPAFAYSVGTPLVYAGLPLVQAAPVEVKEAAEKTETAPVVVSYAGLPLTYTLAAQPVGCQNNDGVTVPCNGGVYAPYLVPAVAAPVAEAKDDGVVKAKREAGAEPEADSEADPEADPWYYYSTYAHAPHAYGYGYGLGYYGGYHGLGYFGRKKREAEAEPEATAEADPEADPWLYYYGGYVPHTYTYSLPYTYAAYHHPLVYVTGGCRNYLGAVVPCAL